ncbi:30S ribosomal protein S8 [Candidatus Curtissbacteria bacterium RBG_13_35_7]|uniref:Small ribosomal subunit protein uS8 n=1 Tax=Candidatus Curtissbacteria bacterium RBG_13_35_7 TaxID=1797705 RepID=A0A1F5G0S9_9BACT|nr:MAG: 30S ribosomal protein S8 [Candidatus Curtissbacteria bacterium RBG_13_35_7]
MDPVADMLTIIRNGYLAHKQQVSVPYSKFKLEIAKVLEKNNYISNVKKEKNSISIDLIYVVNKPKIHQIKKISKLGLRNYSKSKNIKTIKGGKGTIVISTPKGVMTGYDAKKKNLGGEIICEVW